jgi:chromosome segregation ATPase
MDPLERPPSYKLLICNNPQHQELEQQILRQGRDLAEAENTAKNLSTALAGVSIEIEKAIKKISILAGQLEKISLSLVMTREEEAAMASKIEYTIYRLVTPRVQNKET